MAKPSQTLRRTLRSLENRLKGPAAHAYRQTYGRIEGKPQPAIFILSHMRSGSTLLNLILLTHPEITGCGERNRVYGNSLDIDWLALNARWMHRSFFRRFRYVVDQINHNHLTPEPQLLNDPRLRILFLIREPKATLSSILRLTREFYVPWPPKRAVTYYVERLAALGRYARTIDDPTKALTLTYDELVWQSERTLQRLQQFLGLDTGFSENYAPQRFTGVRGDPTPLIKRGHIVRDLDRAAMPIGARALAQGAAAYSACKQVLSRFSQPL